MTEHDTALKHFLSYDNGLLKTQSQLLLGYLKCKIDNCYQSPENTHLAYEKCKEKCGEKLHYFQQFKRETYSEFSKFYTERFLECSRIEGVKEFNDCIDQNKIAMGKNVNELKILLGEISKKLM